MPSKGLSDGIARAISKRPAVWCVFRRNRRCSSPKYGRRFGRFHNFGNEGIEIFTDAQPAAQRREGFGNVPVRAAGVAEHLVGFFEACGQGGLHRAEFHGVGTRLEDGEDARAADTLAQTLNRGFDGGRVVGEIVVNGDAVCRAFDFHAAFDVLNAPKASYTV